VVCYRIEIEDGRENSRPGALTPDLGLGAQDQ
jgi:hypothetical protein